MPKVLVILMIFLIGCKSPSIKPDFFIPITDDELAVALDTIEAFSPNSHISKVITIRPNGKIKYCYVYVSIKGDLKRHYIVSSEGIYDYDPNTGKKGRLVK